MKRTSDGGPAGIKQIAKALGISIGTVDRALHGRQGVSPTTRDRVLKMAKKLNYTPNVAARSLKLNRYFHIGVFLPEQISSFFDPVRAGIRAVADAGLGANFELEFHSHPRLREGDVESMEEHDWRRFDGVIIAPGNPARLEPICQAAAAANKPIVFVTTDAPRAHRLSSVAIESTVSGGIAAELLGQLIPMPRRVVVITGDLRIQDHAEKLRGFAASLATLAPHLSMLPTVESHESREDAHDTTLKLLREYSDVSGVYINTANSLPVIAAIAECGRIGEVKVIATDLFPEMVGMIESGQVFATLHQRPFTQGRMALEILSRYLILGATPRRSIRLAPHLVLRSNLSLFMTEYSQGSEEPESSAMH